MEKIIGWKDQYDRVLRWYKRISDIDQGILHNRNSGYYEDEIYAFFINCYHLKDWMLNDEALIITEKKKKLNEFIDNSKPMKICYDICNSRKHLKLTTPKIDKETQFGPRQHSLNLGGDGPIFSAKYSILCDRETFDAFDLARACIDEWGKFIGDNITRPK